MLHWVLFISLFSSRHRDNLDLPWISPCGSVTGEPAWGWAGQKWATKGGGRSPQEEGTVARSGQCLFVLPESYTHVGMMVLFSDSGWEWGAEGRSLWSDCSTQFSSRGEPETPCQTGEPRAGLKGTCQLPNEFVTWMFQLKEDAFWYSLVVQQHMREVAERRQHLELEHEQALAILKFKQDEIKRLQRVRSTSYPHTVSACLHNCVIWEFVQQEATFGRL